MNLTSTYCFSRKPKILTLNVDNEEANSISDLSTIHDETGIFIYVV